MEKLEIPEGEECGDCPFKLFENDGPVDLSQCAFYGPWWEEGYGLKRCLECLLDHPHGAVIQIIDREVE